MTCGIYKLSFVGTDRVYVGQSIHIEDRYLQHLRNLKADNGKSNEKLANAYAKYGTPTLSILCECDEQDLDKYEEEAFEIFEACTKGLNISNKANGGGVLGAANVRAKYSDDIYERIFLLLLHSDMSISSIASECNVTNNVVTDISRGKSHVRILKSKFPEEYAKLMSTRRTSSMGKFSNMKSVKLLNPEGEPVEVGTTINSFCLLYNLSPSCIGRVVSGERKSHKGWKLYKG